MTALINVSYGQTGSSKKLNAMGMREMQSLAFDQRAAQFLLVKAPPASGKSRALMFIGIDKVKRQGLKKVIVSVPEKSIGGSFETTPLTINGFYSDWTVNDQHNLCTRLSSASKGTVDTLAAFLLSDDDNLVCTHATLRYAIERLGPAAFEDICIAIDEFHHVSTSEDSVLGDQVRQLIENKNTHIVAMTGSYFRGDAAPILMPEDEAKFKKVSYTYYDQLNGYDFLKTLGIGYHFYRNSYLDAIGEVLNPSLKTIIHIPSVRSAESTTEKEIEVGRIVDLLGKYDRFDVATGIHHVFNTKLNRTLKVVNLVEVIDRDVAMRTVRQIKDKDEVDIIIALNLAKEGFDWIWCEHALTVGYRGSMTEVIQIIGRTTRDAPNKGHAQFTNLISEPDAASPRVAEAVNNMLKAIACSLLMEQVLAPVFKFKARKDGDDLDGNPQDVADSGRVGTIVVNGLKQPTSARARQIIETDLIDLKAAILRHPVIMKAALNPEAFPPEVINKALIPKVIAECYPDLSEDGVEEVRQHFLADTIVRSKVMEGGEPGSDLFGGVAESDPIDISAAATDGASGDGHIGDNRFVRFARQFNVADLSIDLIDSINPFQKAYEVLPKNVSSSVLKTIHDAVRATRIEVTEEEAVLMYEQIKEHRLRFGAWPQPTDINPKIARMGEIYIWMRARKAKNKAAQETAG